LSGASRAFSSPVFRRAAAVLFVLALPLALVLTNIRILTFDAAYWQRGYVRNEVDEWTGMSFAQLAEATRQVQAYFRGGPPVSMAVEKISLRPGNPRWGPEPLFNEREQHHLADVRDLLNGATRVQEATIAYLVAAALLLLAVGRAAGARTLARWTTAASLATLALFAVLGLLALVDFSAFWTQFHQLSFDNDLWMLDWETDYMIRFWPPAFWFGAVIDVVVRSAAGALVLLVLAQLYLRR
jgi:integral membrane protein (TIGR01906 family)